MELISSLADTTLKVLMVLLVSASFLGLFAIARMFYDDLVVFPREMNERRRRDPWADESDHQTEHESKF